jgi:hypothetical protein
MLEGRGGEAGLRCGYAFPLIGRDLFPAGIDRQPGAGRRGRNVGLGWRFGQRGHGSLLSIPSSQEAGERRRERKDDGAPLQEPTGHLCLGGNLGKERKKRDEGRQDIRDTCAMAGASLGVECSLRGQRQMKGSLGRCTRSSRRVPVRRAKERDNASWVLEVSRHFRGHELWPWRGWEALGDWRTRRGASSGAVSLLGPFSVPPRCRCWGGRLGGSLSLPGAAGRGSGHRPSCMFALVLRAFCPWPMVSLCRPRELPRSLPLPPAVPFAHQEAAKVPRSQLGPWRTEETPESAGVPGAPFQSSLSQLSIRYCSLKTYPESQSSERPRRGNLPSLAVQ